MHMYAFGLTSPLPDCLHTLCMAPRASEILLSLKFNGYEEVVIKISKQEILFVD